MAREATVESAERESTFCHECALLRLQRTVSYELQNTLISELRCQLLVLQCMHYYDCSVLDLGLVEVPKCVVGLL